MLRRGREREPDLLRTYVLHYTSSAVDPSVTTELRAVVILQLSLLKSQSEFDSMYSPFGQRVSVAASTNYTSLRRQNIHYCERKAEFWRLQRSKGTGVIADPHHEVTGVHLKRCFEQVAFL